jgi:hypothetical protein
MSYPNGYLSAVVATFTVPSGTLTSGTTFAKTYTSRLDLNCELEGAKLLGFIQAGSQLVPTAAITVIGLA